MNEKLIKIYNILIDKKYHTALEISKQLNVSEKTTRKLMKEIKNILKNKGMNILSISGKGYILQGNILKNEKIFFLKQDNIPSTIEERENYIIKRLVKIKKFIKIEELSEELFVSTRTISTDIKRAEKTLKQYDLQIIRKPYYGIKLYGEEIKIRNLLVNIIEQEINLNNEIPKIYGMSITKMVKEIYKFLKSESVKIADRALQNLTIYIYVCLFRNEEKFYLKENDLSRLKLEKSNLFYQKRNIIYKCLNTVFKNIYFNENDVDYITMIFITNESLKYINANVDKTLGVDKLLNDIFYYVHLTFQINFFNDKELYENLYTHLLALIIRLRFDINITNPLLEEIKDNLQLEYNIAMYISKILKNKYNKIISDQEIGYIALILSTSIELNNKKKFKKNILIVCPSGKGVSKFLIHTYNTLFSDYINMISSCGMNELLDIDLNQIDIIFTLIDIEFKVDKPIYKINYFLKDDEIEKIKQILNKEDKFVEKIFPKEIFCYIEDNISKQEIIKLMSKKIKNFVIVPNNIEQLFIQREMLGLTEICPQVAIPHSITMIENVNLIAVCITKYPVFWQENYLNIVLFVLLDNKNNKNKYIYKILTELINDKLSIQELKQKPNYQNFINIMKKFYNQEQLNK